jgi:hypothetical protein
MIESETEVFSIDAVWGCFGFLNAEDIFFTLVVFGLPAGFFGNSGYIVALAFFSPQIVTMSFLIEPFMA